MPSFGAAKSIRRSQDWINNVAENLAKRRAIAKENERRKRVMDYLSGKDAQTYNPDDDILNIGRVANQSPEDILSGMRSARGTDIERRLKESQIEENKARAQSLLDNDLEKEYKQSQIEENKARAKSYGAGDKTANREEARTLRELKRKKEGLQSLIATKYPKMNLDKLLTGGETVPQVPVRKYNQETMSYEETGEKKYDEDVLNYVRLIKELEEEMGAQGEEYVPARQYALKKLGSPPAPVKTGKSVGITKEEYDQLPSGAVFTAPDGTKRKKP